MAKFVVCPGCQGEGYVSNPSIGSFTSDDLDEWFGSGDERYEFLEDYQRRGGPYDIRCEECNGDRVVPQCKVEGCTEPVAPPFKSFWGGAREVFDRCFDHCEAAQDAADYAAECAAEARAFGGGY